MRRELLQRDPDRAIVGRHEVRQDKPTVGKEIEIRKALRRGSPCHIRRISCRRHARRWRLGARKIIPRLGVLLRRLRVVDRPRMKEEARPIDHRAGECCLPSAAQDVADLVAEIPAADIR